MRIVTAMTLLLLQVAVALTALLAAQAQGPTEKQNVNVTTMKPIIIPNNPAVPSRIHYSSILKRAIYVVVAVCALAAGFFIVRAVRASRRMSRSTMRSNGKRGKGHVELEPLAFGRDDDDDDMTIYDASKV